MRDLINGKIANIAMLLISFVFFVFAVLGNTSLMMIVFGLYTVTFLLRLLLPVRFEMPMTVEIPDAEYV